MKKRSGIILGLVGIIFLGASIAQHLLSLVAITHLAIIIWAVGFVALLVGGLLAFL